MKECPVCKTFSVPADNQCLNCYRRWKYVTTYTIGKRGWIFIAFVSFAILYSAYMSYLLLK